MARKWFQRTKLVPLLKALSRVKVTTAPWSVTGRQHRLRAVLGASPAVVALLTFCFTARSPFGFVA